MIALLQRVNHAQVTVDGQLVATIASGLLVFVGVAKGDAEENAQKIFEKIRKFRIFADDNDKLNLNIEQVEGDILLVPQFTLPANTTKGNRPGFDSVADPVLGKQLFESVVKHFKEQTSLHVQTGVFQADMKVLLENDGPLTFWIER